MTINFEPGKGSVNHEYNHIQDHANDLDENPVEEHVEINVPESPPPSAQRPTKHKKVDYQEEPYWSK
jgi:hypothetical protein